MRRSSLATALTLLTVAVPATLQAQTTISARAATLTIGGRLHGQYQTSTVDGAVGDFFIRRARLIADMDYNEFLSGRLQVDFAGGGATLLDAYATMAFDDGFMLSVGQFKRAFDIFELVSSTDLSIIERTGAITGFNDCTGVGSVCSLSRLTEALDYSGRDVGVRVDGTSGTFSYLLTFTNGTGVGVRDENDGKSFSGRASVAASENLTVSANLGLRDYALLGETEHALAWGGDVQYGTWRDGLHVMGAIIGGDNWEALGPGLDPGQFLTTQVMATYYRPLDGDRIVAVEPLARISITDPNDSVDDDGGVLLTPGVMFYFLGRNKLGANLDWYLPSTGDSELSLRLATFLYF
jgi:hypothetical protein